MLEEIKWNIGKNRHKSTYLKELSVWIQIPCRLGSWYHNCYYFLNTAAIKGSWYDVMYQLFILILMIPLRESYYFHFTNKKENQDVRFGHSDLCLHACSFFSDSSMTPWAVICQAPLSMRFFFFFQVRITAVGCHFLLRGSFGHRDPAHNWATWGPSLLPLCSNNGLSSTSINGS